MSESRALAFPGNLSLIEFAGAMAKSGYFKDVRSTAQAIVKIAAGAEMGFQPMASLSHIHIIDGKPSAGVHMLAAIVRKAEDYDYEIRVQSDQACEIMFLRRTDGKWEETYLSRFTIEDARRADLLKKNNWTWYPEDMLYARTFTKGARRVCPHLLLAAAYTPEELGAETDAEGTPIVTIVDPGNGGRPSDQKTKARKAQAKELWERLWKVAQEAGWEGSQRELLGEIGFEGLGKLLSRSEAYGEQYVTELVRRTAAGDEYDGAYTEEDLEQAAENWEQAIAAARELGWKGTGLELLAKVGFTSGLLDVAAFVEQRSVEELVAKVIEAVDPHPTIEGEAEAAQAAASPEDRAKAWRSRGSMIHEAKTQSGLSAKRVITLLAGSDLDPENTTDEDAIAYVVNSSWPAEVIEKALEIAVPDPTTKGRRIQYYTHANHVINALNLSGIPKAEDPDAMLDWLVSHAQERVAQEATKKLKELAEEGTGPTPVGDGELFEEEEDDGLEELPF